jgi:hypothetical protein
VYTRFFAQSRFVQLTIPSTNLYNRRACPTKNKPQQQEISYLTRERGAGRQVSRQEYLRLGLGEIEGRDRETERHRDRPDIKDPEQSRVDQLVFYIIKVLFQPGLGNNGMNFGRNLNHQISYLLLYKCEVADLVERQREREIDRDRESKT